MNPFGNELRPHLVRGADDDYPIIGGWNEIRRRCGRYLHDESRLEGQPIEYIHFPATTLQVAAAVRAARRRAHRIAVSGGRTGIVGGAVPLGAQEMISLERLAFRPVLRRDVDGNWAIHVGAGMTVAELSRTLDCGEVDCRTDPPSEALFYPVDTTERSAQIGGTIATNASGARTLHYGPTRKWVNWIKLVTADGRVLELRRGQVRAAGGVLRYIQEDGHCTVLNIPDLPMPPTKHTAGYYLRANMDAIDLFIGSEGTLGIITEAELRLVPKPTNRLFLTLFLGSEARALDFVEACRRAPCLQPVALEYFGPNAIELLRQKRAELGASAGLVTLPRSARTALYAEFIFNDEGELDALYARLLAVFKSLGLDPASTWAGFTEKEMEQMRELRHAVPEAVNAIIGQRKAKDPQLHKVGTDMAVPHASLRSILELYRTLLGRGGLDYVIFGHIGDGHLHVNILPQSGAQLRQAESVYVEFARQVVRLGGSVAAEHGIGRIKKKLLPVQYSPEQLCAMRSIKQAVDPHCTFNPGVLFDL